VSSFAHQQTATTLKSDGIERILAASAGVEDRSPEEIARDETYWREIQQAFTLDGPRARPDDHR
jgi:hypothetical protein